jgi:hypothetical protein
LLAHASILFPLEKSRLPEGASTQVDYQIKGYP